MNFSAAIRRTGEVSIVDLSGQLTSFASGVLRQTVGDLITQGNKQIVLNVGNLIYLDSSGVGALVNCYMSVIKQGGEMKVVGLTPKVEEVLKITQLYRIFQEFHDEEEALQSFPKLAKKNPPDDRRHRRAESRTQFLHRTKSIREIYSAIAQNFVR